MGLLLCNHDELTLHVSQRQTNAPLSPCGATCASEMWSASSKFFRAVNVQSFHRHGRGAALRPSFAADVRGNVDGFTKYEAGPDPACKGPGPGPPLAVAVNVCAEAGVSAFAVAFNLSTTLVPDVISASPFILLLW